MTVWPEDQLLSAYLDGELTAAEEAKVERLLAAKPAAQQLLDELRALSATLQTLPQQDLGEDLSNRVLRLAERRMLTRPDSGEKSHLDPSLPRKPLLDRTLHRRLLACSGLAAAAGLLWAVLTFPPPDRSGTGGSDREIAWDAIDRTSPPPERSEVGGLAATPPEPEMLEKPSPDMSEPGKADVEPAPDVTLDGIMGAMKPAGRGRPTVTPPAAKRSAKLAEKLKETDSDADFTDRARQGPEALGQKVSRSHGGMPEALKPEDQPQRVGKLVPDQLPKKDAGSFAQESAPKNMKTRSNSPYGVRNKRSELEDAKRNLARPMEPAVPPPSSPPTLHYVVSMEAAGRPALGKLLTENKIAFETAAVQAKSAQIRTFKLPEADLGIARSRDVTETIHVTAPAAKIQNLLRQAYDREETFLSMHTRPGAGVEDLLNFRQFSRDRKATTVQSGEYQREDKAEKNAPVELDDATLQTGTSNAPHRRPNGRGQTTPAASQPRPGPAGPDARTRSTDAADRLQTRAGSELSIEGSPLLHVTLEIRFIEPARVSQSAKTAETTPAPNPAPPPQKRPASAKED